MSGAEPIIAAEAVGTVAAGTAAAEAAVAAEALAAAEAAAAAQAAATAAQAATAMEATSAAASAGNVANPYLINTSFNPQLLAEQGFAKVGESAAQTAGQAAGQASSSPFFDPSQYANQFSKGLLQSSSGLPVDPSLGNLANAPGASIGPASFRPEMLGKAAGGMSLMQGLQAARMASSLGPKQQTAVGPPMRRGQPVNLMQPASLLEQKRKRNPIISLL